MKVRPAQGFSRLPRHTAVVAIQEQQHSDNNTIPDTITKPWSLLSQKTYVFVNINIIDAAAGRVLPNQTVRIAGGKITSIDASISNREGGGEADDAVNSIDCAGRYYLCPGLIDAHVHLTSVPGESDLRSSMSVPNAVSLLRQPFQAGAMLARGYTTARDCGGATLALKEAIADGVFPGPRLFIAGRALSQTGGHGDRRGAHDTTITGGGGGCCGGGSSEGLSLVVDGVPSVLHAARDQLRQGADFLKLMAGGGVASPTDRLAGVQLTAEEIRAAAEVATLFGETFATAHAYTPKVIRHAVENGVRGIEHGNFLDQETARFLADNGVFLTPTLIAYKAMADPKYAAFLPAENRAKNEMVLKEGFKSLKLAYEAGVTMCLGSDLLSFLGVEQLGEFGLRAQVLPCEEVLRHATVNPARMLGQQDRLGQVKEGFVSDLLVLNANPLEDITIFEKPDRHLMAVIKEGRVYNSRWSKLPTDVYARPELIE
ncbi:hypothetical protein M406DRAFT_261815 [Cryphonectria parasitica EP155]|uniref:Amidohydrolase-related domain-containing protein n=1 Tax=Cryphonectria parasitica (strain ATCC 38755 / EP155) TaxID=660469 RepID=A0A9P4XY29_CRYP1|nr:uncharacterized protein M406DRAFT_261815 [Cryphonectria parasitica EP155]KAF3763404.1 hypothetical protein M406DRAFT_261815 [Cryphonectria parasitica EP155]